MTWLVPPEIAPPGQPPVRFRVFDVFARSSRISRSSSPTRRNAPVLVAGSRRRSTANRIARCRSSSRYFLGAATTLILSRNESLQQTRYGTEGAVPGQRVCKNLAMGSDEDRAVGGGAPPPAPGSAGCTPSPPSRPLNTARASHPPPSSPTADAETPMRLRHGGVGRSVRISPGRVGVTTRQRALSPVRRVPISLELGRAFCLGL